MRALRRQLGYWEVTALSLGIMAPTAAMALNGSLAASIAGTAVPLAFLGALVTIALVSYSFIEFSRQYAHAGSVYEFNGRAFGARAGFLSGWAVLLTYVAFTIASIAEIGLFAQTFLSLLGVPMHWLIPALVGAAVIWILAHREVRLSTRTTLAVEGVSVALILVLIAVILGRGGAHGLSLQPFAPPAGGFPAVAFAAVFGFLSFAGFEGAATLGEEAAEPRSAVPRAIASAVLLAGVFYVLATYAQSVGFGLDAGGVKAFAGSSSPLADLARTYVGAAMAAAITAGATVSAFASALGTVTAGSRVLFALSRDGFGPAALSRTHPRFASPHVAVACVMVVALVVDLALFEQTGANVFGYLGTIGVLSLLLVYFATQVAALRLFRATRRWSPPQYLVPLAAMALIAFTVKVNVSPVPAAPYNLFPYVVLAWIVAGVVITAVYPGLTGRIGDRLAPKTVNET